MSLYIPTYEDERAIREVRADILDCIMRVQRVEALKKIYACAHTHERMEFDEHVISLSDFVSLLDIPMQIRLFDVFKTEPEGLIVSDQIKELLSNSIQAYAGEDEIDDDVKPTV